MITDSKFWKDIEAENSNLKELLEENGHSFKDVNNLSREDQIKLDEQWELECEDIRLKQ